MPNQDNRFATIYIPTGNPDTVNENFTSTNINIGNVAYAPGELGANYGYLNKRYQVVELDSTMTTPTTPLQLAYWMDKSKYIVTNVLANAVGGAAMAVNQVAGRFGTVPITPGYRCHVQQRGPSFLLSTGTFTPGTPVIADAATAGGAAAGTLPLASQGLGQATGAAASGQVPVWLDIPSLE